MKRISLSASLLCLCAGLFAQVWQPAAPEAKLFLLRIMKANTKYLFLGDIKTYNSSIGELIKDFDKQLFALSKSLLPCGTFFN